MDISGEVANLHMRTDAKNLVTTARTIHLPEQNETIHMISILRKEACSGSIHDLAHIPTQNNLITTVQTGKLLDADIHPDFRTLIEHKAFLSTWCKTFMHTREKGIFFLGTHKISLAQPHQGGVMHPISLVSDADFDDSTDVDGEKHSQSKHH